MGERPSPQHSDEAPSTEHPDVAEPAGTVTPEAPAAEPAERATTPVQELSPWARPGSDPAWAPQWEPTVSYEPVAMPAPSGQFQPVPGAGPGPGRWQPPPGYQAQPPPALPAAEPKPPVGPPRWPVAVALLNLTGLGLGYWYLERRLRGWLALAGTLALVVIAFATDAADRPWQWVGIAVVWTGLAALDGWRLARRHPE